MVTRSTTNRFVLTKPLYWTASTVPSAIRTRRCAPPLSAVMPTSATRASTKPFSSYSFSIARAPSRNRRLLRTCPTGTFRVRVTSSSVSLVNPSMVMRVTNGFSTTKKTTRNPSRNDSVLTFASANHPVDTIAATSARSRSSDRSSPARTPIESSTTDSGTRSSPRTTTSVIRGIGVGVADGAGDGGAPGVVGDGPGDGAPGGVDGPGDGSAPVTGLPASRATATARAMPARQALALVMSCRWATARPWQSAAASVRVSGAATQWAWTWVLR